MTTELPAKVKTWLDGPTFVVLGTVEPDGRPQLSVTWAARDGDDILISTLKGRRKHRNLLRDPRATVAIVGPDNPYDFVEARCTVTMTEIGGRDLIDDLSEKYRGERPYSGDQPESVRVTLRLHPQRVRFRG
jgi:PPOX class probable F420-dependent enzyme